MPKLWWVLMIVIFLASWLPPGYAASAMSEFLCETGLKFYQQGRYEEALHEFQKALLVEPDYQPALKYIQMLEQGPRPEVAVEEVKLKAAPTGKKEFLPREYKPTSITTGGAIAEMLDLIELQQEMLVEKEMLPRQLIPVVEKPLLKKKEKPTALKALKLYAYLDFIPQP